jgi:hypothetical protein
MSILKKFKKFIAIYLTPIQAKTPRKAVIGQHGLPGESDQSR